MRKAYNCGGGFILPKLLLGLFVTVFAARAGVITSTPVNCQAFGQFVTASGSCSINGAFAGASISPDFTSASTGVGVTGGGGYASATAQYQGDLDFTVTSGPANGYFEPCIMLNYDNSSDAHGLFGNLSVGFGTTARNACGAPVSFDLGVPQDFPAGLYAEASAYQGFNGASATLSFQFFDSSMNPVQGASILTSGSAAGAIDGIPAAGRIGFSCAFARAA